MQRILLFIIFSLLFLGKCWSFHHQSGSLIPPTTFIKSKSFQGRRTTTTKGIQNQCPLLHAINDNNNQLQKNNDNIVSSLTGVSSEDRTRGVLVLLTVPFAWGTFEPAVRYIYAIDPPVPGLLFSIGYYSVAAITLGLFALLQQQQKQQDSSSSSSLVDDSNEGIDSETVIDDSSSSLPIFIRGGLELGTYLFLGNAFQVIGLKTIPSDRAAFLLQLTTIFVPLVQGIIMGSFASTSLSTWLACAVALTGVGVMGLDNTASGGDAASSVILSDDNKNNMLQSLLHQISFSQGDGWIMAAAFAYTFHCIRLELFAKQSNPVQLAAAKATTETAWSLLCLLVVLFNIIPLWSSADEIQHFIGSLSSMNDNNGALIAAVGAVFWTGWVTVAYTIYAQSYGQSRVSPTDANLIYTLQPLCTALFAYVLLHETLGPAGYIGGALIGSAVIFTAMANENDDNDDNKSDEHDDAVELVQSPSK